jgi:hypothetical protein
MNSTPIAAIPSTIPRPFDDEDFFFPDRLELRDPPPGISSRAPHALQRDVEPARSSAKRNVVPHSPQEARIVIQSSS